MPKELAIGSTVYSCTLFKEIKWWVIILFQETVSILYWLLHQEHFLNRRVSVFPLHCGKPMFSPVVKIFLTKTCFSVYITHNFINFTWFALLSHQKFDERFLFKPGACYLIYHHFELPQKKYFWEYEWISNNAEFTFMEKTLK